MQILVEIQNPGKLDFILELLRGLEYVRILPVKTAAEKALPETTNWPDENMTAPDFREFWGCIQPQMGLEAVDRQLQAGLNLVNPFSI